MCLRWFFFDLVGFYEIVTVFYLWGEYLDCYVLLLAYLFVLPRLRHLLLLHFGGLDLWSYRNVLPWALLQLFLTLRLRHVEAYLFSFIILLSSLNNIAFTFFLRSSLICFLNSSRFSLAFSFTYLSSAFSTFSTFFCCSCTFLASIFSYCFCISLAFYY